jgi:hypothetical protein
LREQPTSTVVAITGANTLVEGILARLLAEEGYDVRHLEIDPTGPMDEPFEGVDVVLLAPGLKGGPREAFLKAMKGRQETAAIPVLPLSSALRMALLDELAVSTSWRTLFEELIGQIGDALASAATSAGALVAESCSGAEPPAPPVPPADAAL